MMIYQIQLGRGSEVLNDSLPIYSLLGQETCSSNHCQTSILKLLGLHDLKLLSLLGHQAKGIELQVTGKVILLQHTRLVYRTVRGVNPSSLGTGCLVSSDEGNDDGPEAIRHLGDVGDGRSRDLRIEEEGRSLDLLADEESYNGKHGNATVGKLGFTVSLKGGIGGLLGKPERIEGSYRGEGSGKSIEGGREGRGSLVGRHRGECRGRCCEEGENGGELHLICLVLFKS
mmetsp:Transcript_9443/g.10954  ORF Transcript_9443/g.10954 Transcript_9443/m.10954 type:complete len:229 (+) Transcript_9443:580-1266(+)